LVRTLSKVEVTSVPIFISESQMSGLGLRLHSSKTTTAQKADAYI